MKNMQNEYNSNIFRLATMLYKDDNYNVSRENTIRKIVESIFLEDNRKKTVFEIIQACDTYYSLTFSEEEIKNVIHKYSDKFNIKRVGLGNDLKICLTDKRIQTLNKYDNWQFKKYVDEFLEGNKYDAEIDAEEVLYRFLYEIFISNYASYQYFFNESDIEDDFSVNLKNYNEEEKRIINDFLKFDDDEKDKYIFDIVSLSLEYCILTGDSKQIYSQGIRNKVFYLDSNIIYRAIGINGESRRELTLNFLEKCAENNITLIISQYSQQEFLESINYYLRKIKKYKHRNINVDLYNKYSSGYDIYSFYYEWCSGRANRDITLFNAYINSLYSKFLEEFKIKINYIEYFKDNDEELNNVFSSISNFKGGLREDTSNLIFEFDAKNILTLKRIRHKARDSNKRLLETKHYLISTDQVLKEWDYKENSDKTPLVLLPSQWFAIMLRFVGRTSDDYRSFVSFLNLRQSENSLNSEKLHAILSGISELTEDIKTQERYAEEIIEMRVNDIISMESPTEIYEKTVIYVNGGLEDELKNAKNEIKITREELATTKESMKSNYVTKCRYNENVDKLTSQRNLYRDKLIDKQVEDKLNSWSKMGYGGILCSLIIILWILLHFIFTDSKYNLVYNHIIPYIEALSEYSVGLFKEIDGVISLTLFGAVTKFSYNRLCKDSKRYIEKEKKLREEIAKSVES